MANIAGIRETSELTFDQFLLGCRKYAHWFQPWCGRFHNGRLQDEINWFLDSDAGEDCYIELPRGHTKTVTLAYRLAWEIGNNPAIRIKYIGVNDDEAGKTVKMVGKILQCDGFQQVFPGVISPTAKLGTESFTVERKTNDRDATMEGVGVAGNAGGRCDLLVADDICNLKNAVMQPALRSQVIEYFNNNWLPTRDWSNESNGKRRPRTWRLGTPYHVSDITSQWRTEHRANGTLFRKPVVNYQSPWPEAMKPEMMKKLRRTLGPIAYARAYELVPVSSDVLVFPLDWITASMFEKMPEHVRLTGRRIGAFDLAYTAKSEKKEQPDWSVFITGIRSMQGDLWVDRMWRMRCSFPDFVKIIARNCRSLHVQEIVGENSGGNRVLVDQIRLAVGCSVRGIERDADKVTRAADVQGFVQAGSLHIQRMPLTGTETTAIPELQPLVDEMATFPAGDHDDATDAIVDLINLARSTGTGTAYSPSIVASPKAKLWRIYG